MLSKILDGKRKSSSRRIGNQCRDARDWAGASDAYTQHLEVYNIDQAIWVQLGHAKKELGLLEDAARAYQTAVDLDDRDIDANIHLADVLRRLGDGEAALAVYERVNNIAPNSEALLHIRSLRKDSRATSAVGLGTGTTFFAIQDLFGYLKAHVTMSGIQRVQAGIALHAIRDPNIDVRFILSNVGSDIQTLPAGEFWMVDNTELMRIIDYASGKNVDHETLRLMLISCEDGAERVRPLAGSTVILLGAFWGLGNSVQNFVHSKREGVRIGAYVYDIIPVTHPEFCDDALVTDFSMAICELCATADFILTISDATKTELTNFIAKNRGRAIPMATVPLAHHLTRETDHSVVWPKQLSRVQGKRYVAYVSTIEGRKNHLYVINSWRRLMAEGVNVPDLVFVGRHGWKISALTDVLKATNNLNGRLHIAHNLSDGELNAIYANCEFSVFTSFVEGWGLPVGESLFHGRPCVAADTSSIPEVGGELVDYIDPFNLTQGVEVFRKMITDRAYLRSRVEAIRDHFTPRTWTDVGADFLEKTKSLQDVNVSSFSMKLKEGEAYTLKAHGNERVNVKTYFHKLSRLMIDSEFFYHKEDHGVWMRGANPSISIATEAAPETSVLVYMRLSIAPGALECRLTILDQMTDTETGSIRCKDLSQEGGTIRLPAKVGKDGAIHLRFDVTGPYSGMPGDKRDFAVGLSSIGYAQPQNITARQELLEVMNLRDLAAC
ncbi:tetratricopeptide repeat protein [Novosphingobium sp. PhB57]|uniref:glycosyltransferase n=1 Tax=Novosphingobium sp. PhB57 TaxID=2485107 RepID=UPI00104542D2|nr:glycosyltransferase [Novosphingobium sp. PhB57]TCU51469.1 tetratricopeptide repeat protein [Novosphingobium sp. PhB57]